MTKNSYLVILLILFYGNQGLILFFRKRSYAWLKFIARSLAPDPSTFKYIRL
jgi:hypothetical protein